MELISAPVHDSRAIGSGEELIQTLKRYLACIKDAAEAQSKQETSIKSIIYQLSV